MCFITEFIAEDISIHDPNTQEVKPTSVTFERLFISEGSCRAVRLSKVSLGEIEFEFLEGSMLN